VEMTLNDTLKSVLGSDTRLIADDGVILKNRVQELAIKSDPTLISSLFSNQALKDHFFGQVGEVWLFEREKFLIFLNSKEWLPNSFTKYRNRIGLVTRNEFLGDVSDVVLEWPYKDSLLVGGMKENLGSRSEIFFNEILAPDQVNKLLEPKAFREVRRISKSGEEVVDRFESNQKGERTDNIIMRGNNLLGLASLSKVYSNRVKLIYIDPPYNREAESFYNDSFKRSTWLTFMKNRLELARNLLRKDGVICIQIDETQFAYLKVLCDEVFNYNHLNTVVVKMSEASGVKMSHVDKRLPKVKEYILIYAKESNSVKLNPVKIAKKFTEESQGYLKYYSKIIKNPDAPIERWDIIPLKEYLVGEKIEFENKSEESAFKIKNAARMVYRTNNEELAKLHFDQKLAVVKSATGLEYIWWEGKQLLRLSDYLQESLVDLWTDISTINLNKEGGVEFPNGKKPEALLQRILEIFTDPDDLVLDYHLGSGTTAAVAHKMQRRFIGLEQMNYGVNDSIQRLKNVVNGDASGISQSVGWDGGGSFVYLELAERNADLVGRIETAKTVKQVKELWEEIASSPFLSYKVDVDRVKESSDEFQRLELQEAKSILVEMLDKNALYVNVSELEEIGTLLSSTDIKATKAFYEMG
jgi:adenine-specific DNA-methyltransferase